MKVFIFITLLAMSTGLTIPATSSDPAPVPVQNLKLESTEAKILPIPNAAALQDQPHPPNCTQHGEAGLLLAIQRLEEAPKLDVLLIPIVEEPVPEVEVKTIAAVPADKSKDTTTVPELKSPPPTGTTESVQNSTTEVTTTTSKVTRDAEKSVVGKITPDVEKLMNHTDGLLKPAELPANKTMDTMTPPKDVVSEVTVMVREIPDMTKTDSSTDKDKTMPMGTTATVKKGDETMSSKKDPKAVPVSLEPQAGVPAHDGGAVVGIIKALLGNGNAPGLPATGTLAPAPVTLDIKVPPSGMAPAPAHPSSSAIVPKLPGATVTKPPGPMPVPMRKRSLDFDILRIQPHPMELMKEEFKEAMQTLANENGKGRNRRSYGSSAEIRESDDGYSAVRSSPMLYAVRKAPAEIRASYGSTVREIPEIRSDYGSTVREIPEIRSDYGSTVRKIPEIRSSYGSTIRAVVPEIKTRSRSGYGRSAFRDAPVERSSGYGSEIREIEDEPIVIRSNDYSSVREVPDVRSDDYSSVREVPVVRSSEYGSLVRKFSPKVRSVLTRSSYGSGVARSIDYGGSSTRSRLKSFPIVRSSGYDSVRSIPETRSGYGEVRDFDEERSSYGGSRVRVAEEVPAVRINFKSGAATRSGYGVRDFPAVRSSYASRAPAVRANFEDDDETEGRAGGYISDLSDLKESLDIPVVRSEYDSEPIRVSMEPFEIRNEGRYKRSTGGSWSAGQSSGPIVAARELRTANKLPIVHSIPGKVTVAGSW